MDFLRNLLAGSEADGVSKDQIDRAFAASDEMGQELWNALIARAMGEFGAKGEFAGASILVMTTVWKMLDMAKTAAMKTDEDDPGNVIVTMWEMFEATFGSANAEEAKTKLAEIAKRRGHQ